MDLADDARLAPTLRQDTFPPLLGRDARTNLDALALALDGDAFCTGFDHFVADKQLTFRQVCGIPKTRQEEKNRRRSRHNVAIRRISSGELAQVGDTVLVKEADNKLASEGTRTQLAHKPWAGPWRVTAIW